MSRSDVATPLPTVDPFVLSVRQSIWWIEFVLAHDLDWSDFNTMESASWALWWTARTLITPTMRHGTSDVNFASCASAPALDLFSVEEWTQLRRLDIRSCDLLWEMTVNDEDRPLALAWLNWLDACHCSGNADPDCSVHAHIRALSVFLR